MQTVIDDVLVNYETFGNKKNKPLLILHGWGRNLQDWNQVAIFLSQNYFVVSLDLPGFGGSTIPTKPWDTYDYASFIENLIKKLGIKKPILLGHSLGGRVGIVLGTKKELLSQLILVDTAGIEQRPLSVKVKIAFFKIAKILLPQFLIQRLRKNMGSSDYLQSGKMRETFINIINGNLSPLLSKISVPTLIIWGEKDDSQDVSLAKIAQSLIFHAKLRIVWEAGHHPHLEKPKEFIEILGEEL